MASPLWALVVSERGAAGPAANAAQVPGPGAEVQDGLQAALERVSALVPGSRTVTVVGPSGRQGFSALRSDLDAGRVVKEPADRGTAPAILVGLIDILQARPDAQVVVTTSDHDVRDPYQFRFSIRAATGWIRSGHAETIVFGVKPCGGADVTSWITPKPTVRRQGPRHLLPVSTFVDGTSRGDAKELERSGSVWNTGMLVTKAQALFELYQRAQPDLVDAIMHARQSRATRQDALLAEVYQTARRMEVSSDVLRHARGVVVYTWPASVGWSPRAGQHRLSTWERAGLRQRLAPVLHWAPSSVRRAFGA